MPADPGNRPALAGALRPAILLGAVTAVAVGFLSLTHSGTAERIAANERAFILRNLDDLLPRTARHVFQAVDPEGLLAGLAAPHLAADHHDLFLITRSNVVDKTLGQYQRGDRIHFQHFPPGHWVDAAKNRRGAGDTGVAQQEVDRAVAEMCRELRYRRVVGDIEWMDVDAFVLRV